MVGIGKFAITAVVLGLGAVGLAQAPPHARMRPDNTKQAAKPSAAQPAPVQPPQQAAPQQPAEPARPEQMPPTAPQVTYENGQLSIVAQNSTLSSILAAVKARTGAQLEMPADTVNDRVAVKLGPGNPRDMLASLLEGSRFDYIVLGSATDPTAVAQVILTPHRGGAAAPAVAGAGQSPPPGGAAMSRPGPAGPFRGVVARPELNADEDEPPAAEVQPALPPPAESAAPAAVMPPGTFAPNMQGTQGAEPAPPAVPGQPNPNLPKTPEQLLQELQRMQQQQQRRQPRQPQQ